MSDTATYTAYFNGEWTPYGDVTISPEDRGFVVADVVFDIARTFGGTPFVLDRHIDRLYRSLKYMRIDPGLTLLGIAPFPFFLHYTRRQALAIHTGSRAAQAKLGELSAKVDESLSGQHVIKTNAVVSKVFAAAA